MSDIDSSAEISGGVFLQNYVVWRYRMAGVRFYVGVAVVGVVLLVLGLAGNGLVVHVYRNHFKRSTSNWLIQVLAVVDWNCCLFGLPYELLNSSWSGSFSVLNAERYSCKIFRYIQQSNEVLACLVLLCIAYDRYVLICRPSEHKTMKFAYKLVAWSVAISYLSSLPALMIFGVETWEVGNSTVTLCGFDDLVYDFTVDLPALYFMILEGILLPAIVAMLVMYALIARGLVRWKHAEASKPSDGVKQKSNSRANGHQHKHSPSESVSTISSDVVRRDRQCSPSGFDCSHDCANSQSTKANTDLANNQITMVNTDHANSQTTKANTNENTIQTDMVNTDHANSQTTKANTNENTIQTADKRPVLAAVPNKQTRKSRKVGKSIGMLFLVTVIFILSYTPFLTQIVLMVTGAIDVYEIPDDWQYTWEIFTKSYFFSNALNPIIYAGFNKKFREKCYMVLFVQSKK